MEADPTALSPCSAFLGPHSMQGLSVPQGGQAWGGGSAFCRFCRVFCLDDHDAGIQRLATTPRARWDGNRDCRHPGSFLASGDCLQSVMLAVGFLAISLSNW